MFNTFLSRIIVFRRLMGIIEVIELNRKYYEFKVNQINANDFKTLICNLMNNIEHLFGKIRILRKKQLMNLRQNWRTRDSN